MKDQFIPYEQAKMMKELGFDEKCIAGYSMKMPTLFSDIQHEMKGDKHKNSDGITTAPLYQQAEEWLWEKHYLRIEVMGLTKYHFFIKHIAELFYDGRLSEYNSPITAHREGILKAIEYLYDLQTTKLKNNQLN